MIIFNEVVAPATPALNKVLIYAKADGLLYSKDDAGVETPLGVSTILPVVRGGSGVNVSTGSTTLVLAVNPTLSRVLFSAGIATATGAPVKLTAGANLTVAEPGVIEFDGALFTNTIDAINGRGLITPEHFFMLKANGAAIGPAAADFFGANTAIPLVANGIYEIEIECYFLKTTAGTITWSILNSAVVTNMVANLEISPITGITAAPSASDLLADIVAQTAATASFSASGSLTTGVNHKASFKIRLENATSTNLKLSLVQSLGTITPLRGSFYKVRRVDNAGIRV